MADTVVGDAVEGVTVVAVGIEVDVATVDDVGTVVVDAGAGFVPPPRLITMAATTAMAIATSNSTTRASSGRR